MERKRQRLDLVTEEMELAPEYRTGHLDEGTIRAIQAQARERLGEKNGILKHSLDVKVVCNPRRNFLNITVRSDYITMCHYDFIDGTYYCYFLSMKLEPFVIVTAVDPVRGKLVDLTRKQAEDMNRSRQRFLQKYGITGESYHYTGSKERAEDDKFSKAEGNLRECKAHSLNWHLKIRVATSMFSYVLPVFQLIDLQRVKDTVEPVKYNFTRETLPWEEVWTQILADCR